MLSLALANDSAGLLKDALANKLLSVQATLSCAPRTTFGHLALDMSHFMDENVSHFNVGLLTTEEHHTV